MSTAEIVAIVVALLSSSVLAAVVTAISVRRKVDYEARKLNVDSQAAIIDDLTAEVARLNGEMKELRTNDTSKTKQINDLTAEVAAYRIATMYHEGYDRAVVALLKQNGIDVSSLGSMPSLGPTNSTP